MHGTVFEIYSQAAFLIQKAIGPFLVENGQEAFREEGIVPDIKLSRRNQHLPVLGNDTGQAIDLGFCIGLHGDGKSFRKIGNLIGRFRVHNYLSIGRDQSLALHRCNLIQFFRDLFYGVVLRRDGPFDTLCPDTQGTEHQS